MGLSIYCCLAIIVSSVWGGMVAMVVCWGGQTEACWGICTGGIRASSTFFLMEPSNAYRTLTNVSRQPPASKHVFGPCSRPKRLSLAPLDVESL
jgi:hypothetical protein